MNLNLLPPYSIYFDHNHIFGIVFIVWCYRMKENLIFMTVLKLAIYLNGLDILQLKLKFKILWNRNMMYKSRKQDFLLHPFLVIFLVVTLTVESSDKKFGHQKFFFYPKVILLENHEKTTITILFKNEWIISQLGINQLKKTCQTLIHTLKQNSNKKYNLVLSNLLLSTLNDKLPHHYAHWGSLVLVKGAEI